MLSATLRQTQRNSPRIADHRSSRAFRFVPFVQAAPSPRVHLAGWKDTCFPHSRQTPIPTRSARGDRDCNCSNHDCQQRSRKLRAKRHRTAPDRTDRRRLPSVWAGTGRTARPASRDHQASRSDVLATASGKGPPSIRHRDRSAREARHVHNPFAGSRCRLGSSSGPIGFGSGAPRDIPLGRAVRRSRSPGTSRMRLLAFTAAAPSVPHDATGQGCDGLGA